MEEGRVTETGQVAALLEWNPSHVPESSFPVVLFSLAQICGIFRATTTACESRSGTNIYTPQKYI
jgi:hypothetical protein